MLQQQNHTIQSELKQLWGSFVPPMTKEEIDLAIKLCPKIKSRKHLFAPRKK